MSKSSKYPVDPAWTEEFKHEEERCAEIAQAHGELKRPVLLDWSGRLYKTAGKAWRSYPYSWDAQGRVQLSSKLWPLMTPFMRTDTIRHELAHVYAPPGSSHGEVWQEWAVRFGAEPSACYQLSAENFQCVDTLRAVQGETIRACPRCGGKVKLTKRFLRKFLRTPFFRPLHRKCGGQLDDVWMLQVCADMGVSG